MRRARQLAGKESSRIVNDVPHTDASDRERIGIAVCSVKEALEGRERTGSSNGSYVSCLDWLGWVGMVVTDDLVTDG